MQNVQLSLLRVSLADLCGSLGVLRAASLNKEKAAQMCQGFLSKEAPARMRYVASLLSEFECDLKSLGDLVNTQRTISKDLAGKNQQLSAENATRRASNVALRAMNLATERQLRALHARVTDYAKQAITMQAPALQQAEIEILSARCEGLLSGDPKSSSSTISTLEALRKEVAELEPLRNRVAAMESQVAASEQLRNQLTVLRSQLKEQQADRQALRRQAADIDTLHKEAQSLRDQLANVQGEVASARKETAVAMRRAEEAKSRYRTCKMDLALFERKVRTVNENKLNFEEKLLAKDVSVSYVISVVPAVGTWLRDYQQHVQHLEELLGQREAQQPSWQGVAVAPAAVVASA